jgi:hypothetical protein
MKIIPNRPFDNDSYAERKVFDTLKECFVNENTFVAFHSFNLTDHAKKRVGEADFIILCKYGLFILEVKGGGISHEDGTWFTSNSHGKYSLGEGPFKQANGSMFAIEKKIRNNRKFASLKIPIGFGVIFPDCSWVNQGAEWDRATVCDTKNLRNFEQWLKGLFKYWNNKPNNNNFLSPETIKELKSYLRPDFELVELLYDKILSTEEQTVKLTEDQYFYVDIALENDRVLCSGGAGTGKTFLAAELSRRMAGPNSEVLFVCKSLWLKNYLSKRIVNEHVTISTIDGALQSLRRSGLESFDIVIVDEGQDIFNFEDIEILDSCLNGGLDNGKWYIFHDINNQSDVLSQANDEVLDYLKSLNNPAKVPLRTNCRNTHHILEKVQSSLLLDMGNTGSGEGPDVFEVTKLKDQLVDSLAIKITELLKSNISSSAITILSAVPFDESIVASLPKSILDSILRLDDYSVRNFPPNSISFSEIKNFKGLENEVILLIDLPSPLALSNNDKKSLHYVGMSRARGLLCAFWNA